MRSVFHVKKQRQLRYLVKRLQVLLQHGQSSARSKIELLVTRIKVLVKELSRVLAPVHLKKVLGSAALILGISFSPPVQVAAQSFAAPLENPFGIIPVAEYIGFPAFADLDGDGDQDLMVGQVIDESYDNTEVFYFENTGTVANPQFAAPQGNPFGLAPDTLTLFFPNFADLDNDGDLDLLVPGVTEPYDAVFYYYENTGNATTPQFAAAVSNPFDLNPPDEVDVLIPTLVDLDGDGDIDLLSAEEYGNFQYFENTGSATSPQFALPVENPFGLVATLYYAIPAFSDLDGDGDQDLLVGEDYGNLQYFENTSTVATKEEYADFPLTLYPNPVADVLTIHTDTPLAKIEVYDPLGKLREVYDGAVTTINVSEWPNGIYLLKFLDEQGRYTSRKMLR